MSNYAPTAAITGLIVGIIFGSIISSAVWNMTLRDERQKAIDAGAGQWYIDAKTGDKEFKYGISKEK